MFQWEVFSDDDPPVVTPRFGHVVQTHRFFFFLPALANSGGAFTLGCAWSKKKQQQKNKCVSAGVRPIPSIIDVLDDNEISRALNPKPLLHRYFVNISFELLCLYLLIV